MQGSDSFSLLDPQVRIRTPQQWRLGSHSIQRVDHLRTLIIDGELVHFTPTEYRLLLPIIERAGNPVPFEDLTRAVLDRDLDRDARRLLDKHIDHVRSKLRSVGLNVLCVARYGYLLLPEN